MLSVYRDYEGDAFSAVAAPGDERAGPGVVFGGTGGVDLRPPPSGGTASSQFGSMTGGPPPVSVDGFLEWSESDKPAPGYPETKGGGVPEENVFATWDQAQAQKGKWRAYWDCRDKITADYEKEVAAIKKGAETDKKRLDAKMRNCIKSKTGKIPQDVLNEYLKIGFGKQDKRIKTVGSAAQAAAYMHAVNACAKKYDYLNEVKAIEDAAKEQIDDEYDKMWRRIHAECDKLKPK